MYVMVDILCSAGTVQKNELFIKILRRLSHAALQLYDHEQEPIVN